MLAYLHVVLLILMAGAGAFVLIADAISTLWPEEKTDLDSYDERGWFDL